MASPRFIPPLIFAIMVLAGAGLALGDAPAAEEGAAEAPGDAAEESRPDPATMVLRARKGDHVFTVVVEPGRPQLGRRIGMRLDLATIPPNPDPTFGDRVPVRDASLVALLTRPGEADVYRRQALHPYGGAGSYGLHFTPDKPGLWRVSFERLGEELPEATFRVGVNVDTPTQDDPSLGRGPGGPTRILGGLERGQRGGGVVGPLTPTAAGPTASTVMSAFSDPAGWLTGALAEGEDAHASREAISALLTEARKLRGTVPEQYKVGAEDYDRLASDLVRRLERLASTVEEGELAKARADWRTMLDQTCAQCHVKFWWGITPNLSSWPNVQHQPWRR